MDGLEETMHGPALDDSDGRRSPGYARVGLVGNLGIAPALHAVSVSVYILTQESIYGE